jgi:flavodoxin
MKSTLVAYYSNNGSNKYLAQRIAYALGCDIEPIRPWPGSFPLLLPLSWLKIGAYARISREKLEQYERIIICGPIWMGTLISPLRGVLKKLRNGQQEICHVTCCGSTDKAKDDTFGYATVFPKVRDLVGDRLILSEAFPIELVLTEEEKEDDEKIMNTRLSDENFRGEILDRMHRMVGRLKGDQIMELV